jgi:sugar fermentation stimulation protein A
LGAESLKLPELFEGTLVRRYKRFLADIITKDGEQMTVHCPNTGSMTGCAVPDSRIYYSISDNAKRKYPGTLEFVESDHGLVSVNTGRANALVGEGLTNGYIEALQDYSAIKPEIKIPEGDGRFDFLASADDRLAYVEVKSVTLHIEGTLGAFPDSVSERALKHVNALVRRVAAGDRGVLIFCAQHMGLARVRPASEIDPLYAQSLEQAIAEGVEVLAYGCITDLKTMTLGPQLEFSLT